MDKKQLEADCLALIEQANNDAAHQLDHIKRVVKAAQKIAELEQADINIITAAAYCHDVVNYPKDSELRPLSSRHAADKTAQYLLSLGYDDEFCQAVHHAVAAHSYSANIPAQTLEAQIVQDADRLDGLGAIGVIRCIQVGTALSRTLYESNDPFCQQREPDDSQYTLDHFYNKLFKLPDLMNTESGLKMAQQRIAFMQQFIEQLGHEIS
jgi:uncharacterized protein